MRARLFEEIAKRGMLKGREAALLEVGHSTWSNYGYALAVDGVIQSDPLEAHQGEQSGRERIRIPEVQNFRSYVASNVDDGACWFLTVVHNGQLVQIVQYGRWEEPSESAAVVSRLEKYLIQPELKLQKK